MQKEDSETPMDYFVGQTQEEHTNIPHYYQGTPSEHIVRSPPAAEDSDSNSSDDAETPHNIHTQQSFLPNRNENINVSHSSSSDTDTPSIHHPLNPNNTTTTTSTHDLDHTPSSPTAAIETNQGVSTNTANVNTSTNNNNNRRTRRNHSRCDRCLTFMARSLDNCGSCLGSIIKHLTLLLAFLVLLGNLWLVSAGLALVVSIGRCSARYDCTSSSGASTRTLHWGSGFLGICPWVGMILVTLLALFWWSLWPIWMHAFWARNNQVQSWKDFCVCGLILVVSVVLAMAFTVGMYFPSLIMGDLITSGRCYNMQNCKNALDKLEDMPDRWTTSEGYSMGWGCTAIGGTLWLIPVALIALGLDVIRRTTQPHRNQANNNPKPLPEQAAA